MGKKLKIIKWHTFCFGEQNILEEMDTNRIIRCAFNLNTECMLSCAAFDTESANASCPKAMCRRGSFLIGTMMNWDKLADLL